MSDTLAPVIVNRILVVEDDRDEAEFLKVFLERHGFEVLVAREAGQAHSAFSMRQPDCVLLDLILPNDVSGFEVCERMKVANPAVPIIILSAIELEDEARALQRDGHGPTGDEDAGHHSERNDERREADGDELGWRFSGAEPCSGGEAGDDAKAVQREVRRAGGGG